MRGLSHVCRKEMAFQRLKRDLAFRLLENGRKGFEVAVRAPFYMYQY